MRTESFKSGDKQYTLKIKAEYIDTSTGIVATGVALDWAGVKLQTEVGKTISMSHEDFIYNWREFVVEPYC